MRLGQNVESRAWGTSPVVGVFMGEMLETPNIMGVNIRVTRADGRRGK